MPSHILVGARNTRRGPWAVEWKGPVERCERASQREEVNNTIEASALPVIKYQVPGTYFFIYSEPGAADHDFPPHTDGDCNIPKKIQEISPRLKSEYCIIPHRCTYCCRVRKSLPIIP